LRLGRCYVVVLVPGVTVRDTTFNLVVAFWMGDEVLIILGVKLRGGDVDIPGTQVDEMYALGFHIPLLKRGIRIGVLHIYTSRQPPVLANKWTADGDA
jgi:tRNA pseudouridine-54 N-methylase